MNNQISDDPKSPKWDVDVSTDQLLQNVRSSIHTIPEVRDYARVWRSSGFAIDSTLDLLRCYYSSVRVVNVPAQSRGTNLMLRQLQTLKHEIRQAAVFSHASKERVRMISTSRELGMFMQAGYAHFSQTLDVPFDFIQVSLTINPLPKNMGGNILQLAIEILRVKDCHPDWIFQQLSKLVASCILLDCIRTGRKGK